jgi:hypothetical protein
MSAFLGPIHFWLYNKIGKQEELTKAIASMAAGNGWISDRTAYIRDLPALEDVIDESNIHGWLQDQIHDAETRYADLIQTVLTTHPERLEEISKVAFRYGRRNGRDAEKATDVFRIFEDFFVNGMPCDRVNAVVTESDDEVSWQMTQDIHAQYWDGETNIYYELRDCVMRGMLEGTPFALDSRDDARFTIKRT